MKNCGPYNTPLFIRVFDPNTSSHQMSIPTAFIKNFKGVIPNKVILLDHSKKPWHVELEETNDSLVFSNGWQGFATYHLLECGDFLLFTYLRNSRFEVKVFNKEGCKKEVVVDGNTLHGQDFEVEESRERQEQMVQGSHQHSPKEDPHQIPIIEILDEEEIELETTHLQELPAQEKRHLRIGSKKNEEASCSYKVPRQRKSQHLKQNKMPKDSYFVVPKNPCFVLPISDYSKYNAVGSENELPQQEQNLFWKRVVCFHQQEQCKSGRSMCV